MLGPYVNGMMFSLSVELSKNIILHHLTIQRA